MYGFNAGVKLIRLVLVSKRWEEALIHAAPVQCGDRILIAVVMGLAIVEKLMLIVL